MRSKKNAALSGGLFQFVAAYRCLPFQVTPDQYMGLLLLADAALGRDAYAAFLGAEAARNGGEIPAGWFLGVGLTAAEGEVLAFDVNKRRG